MAANTNDMLKKTGAGTVTSLSAPGKALAATSINVGSTTNYPTDTGFAVAIRQVDSNGNLVDNTYTEWSATVSSATSLAIVATPVYGSDQVYPAGSTTQVYIPLSAYAHNKLIDNILEHANQDGSLISQAVRDALNLDSGSSDGWTPFGYSLTSITALGNRSYTAVVSGVDTTGVTCVGQRLKLPRTVTAPTGSITLNGTTQYLSKATPAGISFTGDHSYQVKIKPTAYQNGFLCSRVTGGNTGFALLFNSSGQIQVQYGNGASLTQIMTYLSVPLNKWINISVAVSVAAKTAVVLLDGVSVPTYLVAGTATTVVQPAAATTLSIGADNAGANFFKGQIAQFGLFTTAVASATLRGYEGQTLAGSESSQISAYKLDQASGLNDLSANANNLTNNGTATYASDTPFTNSVTGTSVTAGTTNYGIIMAQSFSTNTTYTIQIPEGETLPTTGGIGTVSYSTQKTPYGFPGQRGKWGVSAVVSAQLSNVVATMTWANIGSLNLKVPIGSWRLGHEMNIQSNPATAGVVDFTLTLGTTAAAAGDTELTSQSQSNTSAVTMLALGTATTRNRFIDLTSETTYYLNARNNTAPNQTIYIRGDTGQCIIYAENAYL